jgi:hypothetical protein
MLTDVLGVGATKGVVELTGVEGVEGVVGTMGVTGPAEPGAGSLCPGTTSWTLPTSVG